MMSGNSSIYSGNPIFPGWYADPEARIFEGRYWVYPTFSAPYDDQAHFDAFHSEDLVEWTKVERILEMKDISWARRALWAPSPISCGRRADGEARAIRSLTRYPRHLLGLSCVSGRYCSKTLS